VSDLVRVLEALGVTVKVLQFADDEVAVLETQRRLTWAHAQQLGDAWALAMPDERRAIVVSEATVRKEPLAAAGDTGAAPKEDEALASRKEQQ
jgi:hypothetical protein